jgi:hypothetical protein
MPLSHQQFVFPWPTSWACAGADNAIATAAAANVAPIVRKALIFAKDILISFTDRVVSGRRGDFPHRGIRLYMGITMADSC